MNSKDIKFCDRLIGHMKFVQEDNAVRYDLDDGFKLIITAEDVRKNTDRQRIKLGILDSIASYINENTTFSAVTNGRESVVMKVPPLLKMNGKTFSLTEIYRILEVIKKRKTKE